MPTDLTQQQAAAPVQTAPPPPVPAPEHRYRSVLLRLLWGLASICVLVVILGLGQYFWLSAWTQGSMDAGAFARSHAQAAAPAGVSAPDLQKAVEAAVDASIKRDELLLDKLLLVVGLYTTILSVLALATVFASRQDAKEQLAGVNAKADALAAEVKQKLTDIQAKAQADVNALKAQITSEFPIISRLQDRVQNLILDLEDRFPEDEDMNRDLTGAESWQAEERQQRILIDESQILAVSVVALDSANLLKLYLALARSYFQRSITGTFTRSDAARASLYAGRATDCNPKSVDAFRLRGATALALYHLGTEKGWSLEELKSLIERARKDFTRCKEIDPIDAGALYNLALLSSYEGAPDAAIRLSEELLAARQNVPRKAKEKYFPDVYINIGCFLADKLKTVKDPADRKILCDRIVKECTAGRDYLQDKVKSTKALDTFTTSLKRELSPDEDFSALPEETKTALEALLHPPPPPVEVAQTPPITK